MESENPKRPQGVIYEVVFRPRPEARLGTVEEVVYWSRKASTDDAKAEGLQLLRASGRNPDDFEEPQLR